MREAVAQGQTGPAQPDGAVHEVFEEVFVTPAGGRFGHEGDGDVVGVGVLVQGAREEVQRLVRDEVEERARVEDVAGVGLKDPQELGEAEKSGRPLVCWRS